MHARRRFLRGALAVLAAGPALAKAAAAPARLVADFDALWRAIDEGYAYLEPAQDWRSAASRWRPKAAAARTREDLLAALEGALAELNDEHVTLDAHLPGSPRTVPTATDLWAEWIGPDAVISAVRAGSVADVAGAVPGMQVDRGREDARGAGRARAAAPRPPVRPAGAGLGPAPPGRRAVVGHCSPSRRRHAGRARRLGIDRQDLPASETPPLVARRIGEDRGLGYLRLKNTLGEAGIVQHFDAALQHLKGPAGPDPRPARNAVGRIARRRARAARTLRDRRVARGSCARRAARRSRDPAAGAGARRAGHSPTPARTLVLVDHWTAGEGESLAFGLETAARATLSARRWPGCAAIPARCACPRRASCCAIRRRGSSTPTARRARSCARPCR